MGVSVAIPSAAKAGGVSDGNGTTEVVPSRSRAL